MSGPTFVDNSALGEEVTSIMYLLGVVQDAVVVESERQEMLRLYSDPDPQKQQVGPRAALTLIELQSLPGVTVLMDRQAPTDPHPDTDLINRAEATGGRILTADGGLYKEATARGITVLFVLEWLSRLQHLMPRLNKLCPPMQAFSPGDILTVQVVKRGRDAYQGIAYLPAPDRRKVVIKGGAAYVGQAIAVRVERIYQPSPGYEIIFAVPAVPAAET